ncbi:MAG: YbbR-like domain-containing protein [Prevotella sp.]|nr:YbbR-like domain-containing protein [Prevotella sp.]
MKIFGILRYIKLFLFSRANKEFVVFMVFLALSGIFWLLTTLNQVYEHEFAIPVSVVGVPKNAVLTSDETDTVRMTIRDKGITLLTYMYGDVLRKINVSFKTYSKSNGTGSISASDLQKLVYQQLANGSRITSIKPDKLEFYYNYGAKKMVPVRWSGRVMPEEMFFISRVAYSPDSITIYASHEKLDSINVVYTEQLNYANFRDTLNANCELAKIKGVKMVPDHVKVTFFTDVLTEEQIEGVPIKAINMPVGKHLRTFPAKVNISFVTGVSVYRNLKPTDFTVVADYNDIINHPTEKCHIYLKSVPRGISRTRLETNMVDYLIEDAE